ncbi:secreted RxLR effector protein 161-like [Arachis stenosperma]|uniref:secreted RxLR effector protein 161-like n=1 Tax=Arachis stenosperma TaxID=217475 RepID=UPI0025AC7A4F|nr:secreted RxLR effector protein 161-like [Arachis stenosperma]
MTDLSLMSYFLRIVVLQKDDGIFISQRKYANDILKKFQIEHSKPVSTPVKEKLKLLREDKGRAVNLTYYKNLIGSLRYLTAIRPDIVFGVDLLSRFMEESCTNHLQAAKRILRYIKGTLNDDIYYENTNEVNLIDHTDSEWVGDIKTRKSTSGFAFHIGSGAISWSSKKQPVVAFSTAEAEYIAAASCATQAVWLRRILEELNEKQSTLTAIFCETSQLLYFTKIQYSMEDRSILIFEFIK